MPTLLDASVSYIINDDFISYRSLVEDNFGPAVSFPRGTVVSQCGILLDRVYFLLKGMIKIYTVNASGYIRILGYHKGNTIFSMNGLCGNMPAVVSTECVTPVLAIPLYPKDIETLGKLDSRFMPDLARYYCRILRLMCVDAENQSIPDARERLANFLSLYLEHVKCGEDPVIHMSQEELASAVNCSRVQIARICGEMQKEGIIETGHRKLLVKYPELLNVDRTAL